MNIYNIIKMILSVIALAAFVVETIYLIKWLVMFISRNPDKEKRNRTAIITVIAFAVFGLSLFLSLAVSIKQYTKPFDLSQAPTFTVQSDSLKDGVWDEEIGAKHGNKSPELHWDSVENAPIYAIVMIDPDGNNWLHWAVSSKDSNVALGEFSSENGDNLGYVGPYPPSGTHTYDVYIFALKGESRGLSVQLDKAGADLDTIANDLNSGLYTDYDNIISYGKISGTYSAD